MSYIKKQSFADAPQNFLKILQIKQENICVGVSSSLLNPNLGGSGGSFTPWAPPPPHVGFL